MTRMEAAQRICKHLESLIPGLRRDVAGKDLRPGHGAERWVSGLWIYIPNGLDFEQERPKDDDPIRFSITFGGSELCQAALDDLRKLQIEAKVINPHNITLQCDGEDLPTWIGTWRIVFDLPVDWEPSV